MSNNERYYPPEYIGNRMKEVADYLRMFNKSREILEEKFKVTDDMKMTAYIFVINWIRTRLKLERLENLETMTLEQLEKEYIKVKMAEELDK